MGRPRRKTARKRRVGGKITFTQRTRLIEKNDATMVVKPDTTAYPRMVIQSPRNNGAVFKIKMKRKNG